MKMQFNKFDLGKTNVRSRESKLSYGKSFCLTWEGCSQDIAHLTFIKEKAKKGQCV